MQLDSFENLLKKVLNKTRQQKILSDKEIMDIVGKGLEIPQEVDLVSRYKIEILKEMQHINIKDKIPNIHVLVIKKVQDMFSEVLSSLSFQPIARPATRGENIEKVFVGKIKDDLEITLVPQHDGTMMTLESKGKDPYTIELSRDGKILQYFSNTHFIDIVLKEKGRYSLNVITDFEPIHFFIEIN